MLSRFVRLLAQFFVPVLLLGAQSPTREPSAADPVIRVTVGLVQVDAVVTDAKGNHVADLKPDDFEILEDGKRQRITHFSYVKSTPVAAEPSQGEVSTRNTVVDRAAGPVRQLRADEVRRMFVLVADTLGISAENIPRVRNTIRNFIENQMEPGDLVAVVTTSRGMGALQQLTNDKRQLRSAIDHIRWVPFGRNGVSAFEPINEEPLPDDPVLAQMMQEQKDFEQAAENARSDHFALGTLGTLQYVIQGLREYAGRKSVVIFSEGFPLLRTQTVDRMAASSRSQAPEQDDRIRTAARKLTDLANRSGVVMYSFDLRGLAVTGITAADRIAARPKDPGHISALERDRLNTYRDSQDGMAVLAEDTGGLFIHDRNDFETALAKALDDGSGYYLIGYQPQRQETSDRSNPKAKEAFHRIQVRVKRSGLHVRSRKGYVGMPDSLSEPRTPQGRTEQIRQALHSPFQMTDLHIKLSPFYSPTRIAPRAGSEMAVLRALVHVDLRDITFNAGSEDKKRAEMDFICAAYDASSHVVASSEKRYAIEATPAQYDALAASGANYQMDFPVSSPGPYQIRVVVRDAASGKTGSASAFAQIPDYAKPAMALSSLVLFEHADGQNSALLDSNVSGAGLSSTRLFAPGTSLSYVANVFHPALSGETGKPDLRMEIRLYREEKRIFGSQPFSVTIPNSWSKQNNVIPAMGKINIPASMTPGDYRVGLVIYDRVADPKSAHGVAQWMDFTLAKPRSAKSPENRPLF